MILNHNWFDWKISQLSILVYMINVVDGFTMVKKLQNHILVLEKSIDRLHTSQKALDYQIKKLENFNIASIVGQTKLD